MTTGNERARTTPLRGGTIDGESAVLPERDQLGDLLAGEQLGGDEAQLGCVVQGRIDHRGGDPVSLEGRVDRHPVPAHQPRTIGVGCNRIEPAGAPSTVA